MLRLTNQWVLAQNVIGAFLDCEMVLGCEYLIFGGCTRNMVSGRIPNPYARDGRIEHDQREYRDDDAARDDTALSRRYHLWLRILSLKFLVDWKSLHSSNK
jgi:hypothetical protein